MDNAFQGGNVCSRQMGDGGTGSACSQHVAGGRTMLRCHECLSHCAGSSWHVARTGVLPPDIHPSSHPRLLSSPTPRTSGAQTTPEHQAPDTHTLVLQCRHHGCCSTTRLSHWHSPIPPFSLMAQPSTQQQQLPNRPARLSSAKGAFALASSSGSSSPSPTAILPPSHTTTGQHTSISDQSDPDDDSDDNDLPLPFPAALARSDFLAPDFDPPAYLSQLVATNRHQTLEDLRSDLRDRSAAISVELLELVNANYTAFLSLGSELKGGEERVEDVRVSLLGFRRAVEEIKGRVGERGAEVGKLNGELLAVRRDIERGRMMVELDERVAEVEGRLALGSEPARHSGQHHDDEEDDEEDDDDDDEETDDDASEQRPPHVRHAGQGSTASPAKLAQLARAFVAIEDLANEIGRDTPFVRKMDERLIRCRNTILLDLNTALKEARREAKTESKGTGARRKASAARLLRLMDIYATLDAQGEAVKALRSV
ncbi:oligomeric golgi complex component, COG2-domain-containing protein [Microdochium trichocladiopsis]|uniref:Conserved oligomeric Golgi complex subunit 2 n=1 Tax=Microdochium trichocladiopsis TaxID=1682393 RepID=A0A9P9BSB8_9PEZI|nr:oligomeric golgi complex component, COG2-domain-containing protein [Microdochium trichocladiopsis]KAH7033685.1 oligomeric golgi complex component, COG2-domain-containing protein [Microdochium trichocladiopsis]